MKWARPYLIGSRSRKDDRHPANYIGDRDLHWEVEFKAWIETGKVVHANAGDCDAVLNGHSRSVLAQFGLTPKSKRGLAAGEAGAAVDPLDGV